MAATALGLRIDMVSGTVYYPVAGTGGEVGGQGEPGRPVGRLSVVGTYCDDVLMAAHDAELGTAPPIRMDLWGAAGGSVDEQVHVDFQAAAFRGAAIVQLGLPGWRFAPEPESGCGDAATADDAGSRAADSAAAGGSGAGAADSVGLPKFPGEWAESAAEDSYSESWIGVCRLCFAHGYEAEADINIDPRDVEDGCWMSKYWRGPNGRVYMGGQFSSGESPARPGGGARTSSRRQFASRQHGGRTSPLQRDGLRCRSGQRKKARGARQHWSSGSCWLRGAVLSEPLRPGDWGKGGDSCRVSLRACRLSSGGNHPRAQSSGLRGACPGGGN